MSGSHGPPGGSVTFELVGWNDGDRRRLTGLLDAAGILHAWEGESVMVSADQAQRVLEVMAEADPGARLLSDDGVTVLGPAAPPVVAETADDRPVGPGLRLVGAVIDTVVLGIASLLVLALAGGGIGADRPAGAGMVFVLNALLRAGYHVLPVCLTGRTVGTLVAHTRIVDVGRGAPPQPGQAARRFGVWYLAGLLAYVPLVGVPLSLVALVVVFGPMFRRSDRRGLHDLASGTTVVRDGARRS